MNARAVAIPADILEAVFREARRAFPNECCGWLAGNKQDFRVDRVRPCENAQDGGQHPTAADTAAERAYVIAGDDLLTLARDLDGPTPPLVIYHSHPNGRAYFSQTDQVVATSPWGDGPTYPVQQLVVGIDQTRVVEAALFDWSEDNQRFVEIARFPGANV